VLSPPNPGHPVDEGVDDAAQRRVGHGSVLERSDPHDEPVVEDVRLELERLGLHGRSERCRRERELVDPVDGEIEPRAQATEHEGDDPRAAQAGGNGEENRVAHVPVVWRSDRAAPALAVAPGLREKASSTLLPVRDAKLRLSTETSEGLAIVHVTGDFDLSNVQIFEAELEQSLSAEVVAIELAACTFLDSSALQSLVRAQRRVAEVGGRLVLVAPSQPAKRVLDIATLDRFIPVAATLAEAVTSVA
jgi:anti-anti-sigma factor